MQKTVTSKSGKKIIFRPLKKGDLKAMYAYAKEIEAENTYILLNPKEPIRRKTVFLV